MVSEQLLVQHWHKTTNSSLCCLPSCLPPCHMLSTIVVYHTILCFYNIVYYLCTLFVKCCLMWTSSTVDNCLTEQHSTSDKRVLKYLGALLLPGLVHIEASIHIVLLIHIKLLLPAFTPYVTYIFIPCCDSVLVSFLARLIPYLPYWQQNHPA